MLMAFGLFFKYFTRTTDLGVLDPSNCANPPTNISLICLLCFPLISGFVRRRPSTKDLGELVQASKDILDSPTYPPVDSVDPTGAEEELFDDHYTMTLVADKRRWTVGKLSIAMMVVFSLANLLLNIVDARMESLVPPDHYGELSGEGIRPAFGANAGSERITRKPRLGLGSAAISSVTTALSPILPFTGGIDLRREDYWTNGVIGSVSSVYERVQEAFSTSYPSMNESHIYV